jgi:glucan phosphoethanolaminetransferase (alkaline phosphatase superfamily)
MFEIPINKLNPKDFSKYFVMLIWALSLFMPGYFYIYLTDKNLLNASSNLVLILTSIMYSLPILIIWLAVFLYIEKSRKYKVYNCIAGTAFATLFFSYSFIVIKYLGWFKTILGFEIKDIYLFYSVHLIFILVALFDRKNLASSKGNKK